MKKALVNSHVYDNLMGTFQSNTTILWVDGVIKEIGSNIEVPTDTEIIDGKGRFVTPGLIDSFTQLGLKESGVRWEGDDSHELSNSSQGMLSVIDGIYPLDTSFGEARANGITTVHVAPGPYNVISGQTAIIKTGGNVIDEMIVKARYGLAVSFGEQPKRLNRESLIYPLTRMGIAALLRSELRKAKFTPENSADERMTLLQKVLQRKAPLFVRAYRTDDIMTALRFKEEFDINLVLVHAIEGARVADKIAQAEVPVLAGPFFQDRSRFELKNLDPSTSVHLQQAGISMALITDHPTSAIRNLSLEIALAVRQGMSKSDAIDKVTLGAAKLLGLDDKVGSLEVGKAADLAIWNKEPFELTSRVSQTLIDGQVIYTREGGKK